MRKINFLMIALIISVITVGCGKKDEQSSSSKVNQKAEVMTPYKMVNSEKDSLWFEISKLDKNAAIESAYIFNNGSVVSYNDLSEPRESEKITLGDITKLEQKELNDKIRKIYMENKKMNMNIQLIILKKA